MYFVFGNHDYYLVSKKQSKKYHERSLAREEELLRMIKELSNVKALRQFEKTYYKGMCFAGATSRSPLDDLLDYQYFKTIANDSRLIIGLNIAKLHHQEKAAYDRMGEVDVLVTHVPPLVIDSHKKYGTHACYLNELKMINAKVCIFGHCHEQKVNEKSGIIFAINALGYPDEHLVKKIKSILVHK